MTIKPVRLAAPVFFARLYLTTVAGDKKRGRRKPAPDIPTYAPKHSWKGKSEVITGGEKEHAGALLTLDLKLIHNTGPHIV